MQQLTVILVMDTTFPILVGEHTHVKKERQDHRFWTPFSKDNFTTFTKDSFLLHYIILKLWSCVYLKQQKEYFIPASLNNLRNVHLKLYLQWDKNLAIRQRRHLYKYL